MITNGSLIESTSHVSTAISRISLGTKRICMLNGYVVRVLCTILPTNGLADATLPDTTELCLHIHSDHVLGTRFRGSATRIQSIANAPEMSPGG